MEGEVLIKLFENIGVPAAVCFYTLFRVNQTLRDLTAAINKLTTDVNRRLEKLEEKNRDLAAEVKSLRRRED